MKNKNLNKAKAEKNGEFYTQLSDIENELHNYKEHFKNKIILCNCDDPEWSNFWQYFHLNFDFLGLQKLITVHYDKLQPSYKLELEYVNGIKETTKTALNSNGDFRNTESIEILKECDIVITNPPFSLFREFVDLLIKHDKKFLIIGSQNAITYKEIFKHIVNHKLWLGICNPKEFMTLTGILRKFGNICWFTNLYHSKRNKPLKLHQKFSVEKYPKYDNYFAFEVSKVANIPVDTAIDVLLTKREVNYLALFKIWYELIDTVASKYHVRMKPIWGVPITFMNHFNPEQFEILDANDVKIDGAIKDLTARPIVKGIELYRRILIKRKS